MKYIIDKDINSKFSLKYKIFNIHIGKMGIIESCWESSTNGMDQKRYQNVRLIFYAAAVLVTHMIAAVYFQKIIKVPYPVSGGQVDIDGTIKTDLFQNPFGIPIFDNIFGIFAGFFTYQYMTLSTQTLQLPLFEVLKLSVFFYLGLLLLVITSIQTSFITVSIINSSQLIIIVLLAVFLSKSSPRFKVQKRQIVISGFLVLGIVIYQYFSRLNQGGANKQITWISAILIILLLLVGGYRPQIMAQIRDKYSPSPAYLQFMVSMFTLGMLLLTSGITTYLWKFIKFVWSHDGLMLDLCLQSFFYSIGQIFVFRAGVQYKQHIMATIGVIRKLLSSLFSAIYFHHNLHLIQYVGITIVFGALMVDIYLNYKETEEDNCLDSTKLDHMEVQNQLPQKNQEQRQTSA